MKRRSGPGWDERRSSPLHFLLLDGIFVFHGLLGFEIWIRWLRSDFVDGIDEKLSQNRMVEKIKSNRTFFVVTYRG